MFTQHHSSPSIFDSYSNMVDTLATWTSEQAPGQSATLPKRFVSLIPNSLKEPLPAGTDPPMEFNRNHKSFPSPRKDASRVSHLILNSAWKSWNTNFLVHFFFTCFEKDRFSRTRFHPSLLLELLDFFGGECFSPCLLGFSFKYDHVVKLYMHFRRNGFLFESSRKELDLNLPRQRDLCVKTWAILRGLYACLDDVSVSTSSSSH